MPLFGGVRGLGRFGDLGFRALFGIEILSGELFPGSWLCWPPPSVFPSIVIRGPLGLAFRAMRDNPGYAMSRGISQFKYQLWLFAPVGIFHRACRSLLCCQLSRCRTDVFSISLLLFLLSMIVVGGIGTVWGPLVGAAVLMLADEGFKEFQDWRALGMGLILPLFVVLLPGGLISLFDRRRSRAATAKRMAAVPPA